MIKKLLTAFTVLLFTLTLVGCLEDADTPSLTSVGVNTYGEWVATFDDGSEEVIAHDPEMIENISSDHQDRLVLHFKSGGAQIYDVNIRLDYHHVNFFVDGDLHYFQVVRDKEDAYEPPTPNIEGKTFTHWDQSYENITEDKEIHAEFEEHTYDVTFVIQDDKTTVEEQTVAHGETIEEMPSTHKEGYLFGGFYTDDTYETLFDPHTPITEDMMLFAYWIDGSDYGPELFEEVLNTLRQTHYKYISDSTFYQYAIEGLINALEDPYTNYLTPEEMERWSDSLGESFVGVGITIENINDNVVIRKVWSDSPAERAGLAPGDIITHINNQDYRNVSYIDTVIDLLGEEDSTVEIGVKRSGFSEILYFEMTRERIDNPTVEYQIIEDDGKSLGYIKINSFGSETAQNMKNALNSLESDGIDGLIIDLRNNGGGYLNAVLPMMDVFLTEGDLPMMSYQMMYGNRDVYQQSFDATGDEKKPYDIAVLINHYSASASEVFAAAMKEKGDYELIGTHTFGKGSMQVGRELIYESTLNYSIGKWFTPSGRWIHAGEGDADYIHPTIDVEQNPYFRAFRILVNDDDPMVFDQVSQRIINAQNILNAMGYEVRNDGYFDQETKNAVLDLQSQNDLEETGTINVQTADFMSDWLLNYIQDKDNDTQLQTAIDYFNEAD